jgi:hypothetical protein
VVVGTAAAAFNAGLVAVLSGIVAAAAWRALVRTGNRNVGYIIAAFALLALKNLAKAAALSSDMDGPDQEFLFSLVDLVVVGLIAYPIVLRRGGAAA